MSHDLPTSEIRAATEVRFSSRSMLIAMAVVAVTCAVLGAFLKRFPADAQFRLLVFWGLLAVLLAAIFVFNARQRYVAEKKAGRVYFQLPPHSFVLPKAPRLMTILFGSFLLSLGPIAWMSGSLIIARNDRAEWWQLLNWWTFYALCCSGVGITYLWWHRRVRVCDRGVVVRNTFIPWDECRRWYWDACNRGVVVMEWRKDSRVAVHVPLEERELLGKLLAEKRPE